MSYSVLTAKNIDTQGNTAHMIKPNYQTWGCYSTNPKGLFLFQLVTINHLTILNPQNSTYWDTSTSKRPDILDMFMRKIPININYLNKNFLDSSSDHTPVFLSLYGHLSTMPKKACLTNNSTNWVKFREIISSKIIQNTSLKNPNNIEDAVKIFTKSIHQLLGIQLPHKFSCKHLFNSHSR